MKIWLDDIREPPDNTWIVCRRASSCIILLDMLDCRVDLLSLDHDLGDDVAGTGYDVLVWLEQRLFNHPKNRVPKIIRVHSANPVGAARMQKAIDAIRKRERWLQSF